MKKTILAIVLMILVSGTYAQNKGQQTHCKSNHKIENFVSDLSPLQKRKLEEISNSSQTKISQLKKELHAVRDSIHSYMETYGDNTTKVYPLFEREAALELEINKVMYNNKVSVDKILTKEQYNTMKKNCAAARKKAQEQKKGCAKK